MDSLNLRYPALEDDLIHFWICSTRAAHLLQLAPDSTPRTTVHHLQVSTQINSYDCGLFVLAYLRATQTWLQTHLQTPRSPMDLRLTTLKATVQKVNQMEVTELRKQLRQTLHQHCLIHTPAPPAFQCQFLREDCNCLRTAQNVPPYSPANTVSPTDHLPAPAIPRPPPRLRKGLGHHHSGLHKGRHEGQPNRCFVI